MSDEFDCAKLLIVRNKFLCCVPVGEIGLKEHLKGISWNEQALLLDCTVNSVLLQEYPIKISFQKAFLKALIEILEQYCEEVHDILYDTYCMLLNTVDEAKYYYKHYCIEDKVITLKENKNFISEGTTGLCSWQAALALSEYCLANKHHLQKKVILELGSGVGLVGITVALHCQPSAIYLTDCHPKVLTVLAENVSVNLTANSSAANPHTIKGTTLADSHTVKPVDSADREPVNCHTIKETSSARFDSIPTVDSSERCRESVNRYTIKETVSARFDSIPVKNSIASPVNSHTIKETLPRAEFDSYGRHTVKETVQLPAQSASSLNTSVSEKCTGQLDDEFDGKFDSSSSVLLHTVKDGTGVGVFCLPWESVDEIECCATILPDLILAADVVYDSSVFEPLCRAVKHFLDLNKQCQVIFACTERNTDTLKEFIRLLETHNFNINELSSPKSNYFYWSTEIPIRFFMVTAL